MMRVRNDKGPEPHARRWVPADNERGLPRSDTREQDEVARAGDWRQHERRTCAQQLDVARAGCARHDFQILEDARGHDADAMVAHPGLPPTKRDLCRCPRSLYTHHPDPKRASATACFSRDLIFRMQISLRSGPRLPDDPCGGAVDSGFFLETGFRLRLEPASTLTRTRRKPSSA